MLQTETFLQERFENPILSLSVYIQYCIFTIFGRVQVDNRWPPDQLWLACMRGLLTVSRRGAPSPVYYPLIFPALRFAGHATAASRHSRPLARSLVREVDPTGLQTLIYVL